MNILFQKLKNAVLIFPDGSIHSGYGIGNEGVAIGEICFNTSITGYQEILTDPSYAGQIINFTFPHIGNVGVNENDIESRSVQAKGLIIKEVITNPSNYRSQNHLNKWLQKNNLIGICGVDTRQITKNIRINAIAPGLTNTNLALPITSNIAALNISKAMHPLGRIGEISDIVNCATMLVDPQNSWITGQIISVDGGLSTIATKK